MFGLGMPEILLILAIALIVIGPKKLPELAKTLGRAMGEFKRSAQDFKNSIDVETTVKDFDKPDEPATSLKEAVKQTQEKSETENEPLEEAETDTDTESDTVEKENETQSGPKSSDSK